MAAYAAGSVDQEGRESQVNGENLRPWVVVTTARAPSNIAVVKYWGKRNEDLILPLNESLSVTLDPSHLSATTSVAASPGFDKDRLWLNGKEVSFEGARYQRCLREIRQRATTVKVRAVLAVEGEGEEDVEITKEQWMKLHVHVVSENNFPTAAGLASSAAGFACLVYAMAGLMGVEEAYPGELSTIARMGSGSACRSLYSGFVKWNLGKEEDGRDSTAEQIADNHHWDDLVVIVLVVNDRKKETSSTAGMRESVATSPLLSFRAKEVVPKRMRDMEDAIKAKDFERFARLTCADSNSFHATCHDTVPPIFYLNDTSKSVIGLVEKWNKEEGRAMAAYTFDAGPNAVLFTPSQNALPLLQKVITSFPPLPDTPLERFIVGDKSWVSRLQPQFQEISARGQETLSPMVRGGEVQYLICTKVGTGAEILPPERTLIHSASGLPKC